MSGYLSIIVASILFGVAGAVAKMLFHADITPLDLTILRAFVAFGVLAALGGLGIFSLRVTRKDIPYLLGLGLLLSAVNYTFYLSISLTSVAVAIMLEYTAPVFVLVFGIAAGTSRLDKATSIVLALSISGCFLLAGGYDAEFFHENFWGVMAGLLCGASFALYNIWGNRGHERKLSSWTMTFYSFGVSAVFWGFFTPAMTVGTASFNPETIGYLIFIGVFATVLPYWLYIFGLKTVPAFQATVIGMLDPIAAAIAAFILVGEALQAAQIAGIGLILAAILYLKKRDEKEPAPAEPGSVPERSTAT
jgi:drug/metabolite transporter (DMT)-like permease